MNDNMNNIKDKKQIRSSIKVTDAAKYKKKNNDNIRRTRITNSKEKRRNVVNAKRRKIITSDKSSESIDEIEINHLDMYEQLSEEDIEKVKLKLSSNQFTIQERFQALQTIRQILSSHKNVPIDKIADSGIVEILVELLIGKHDLSDNTRSSSIKGINDQRCQIEILWCLTNLSTGSYNYTKQLLPVVPYLIQLLLNPSTKNQIIENAAWTIGNIAGECDEFRKNLIESGVIAPLVMLLKRQEPNLVKTAAWTLSNLARGSHNFAHNFADAEIIPIILKLLNDYNLRHKVPVDVVIELVWIICFMSAREENILRNMLDAGLIEILLPFCLNIDILVLTPVLRTFGNICSCYAETKHNEQLKEFSGSDTWQLLYFNKLADNIIFLQQLKDILESKYEGYDVLLKEDIWIIFNLICGRESIVHTFLENNFLCLLIHHFINGKLEVRKEAAFVLFEISKNTNYLNSIATEEVVSKFLSQLQVADMALINVSLRFIELFLRNLKGNNGNGVKLVESLNGIEQLENLQYSEDKTLGIWAESLVNEFYGENYEADIESHNVTSNNNKQNKETKLNFQLPAGRGAHMTKPAWINK